MSEVVIVAAFRTPIGSFNGSLSSFRADELGSQLLRHIMSETGAVPDEVILGQALTAAQGQNPARQTALNAGCPNQTTATTINMLCGSGLKSVALAYQAIKSGDCQIVVCGGQESMSKAPHSLHLRNGHKMSDTTMTDTMIKDGLTDAFNNVHMGNTAEHVASVFNITRDDQDRFALASQLKYQNAFKSGHFKAEIVAVKVLLKKETKLIEDDEYPKSDTSLEALSKLRPCFLSHGGTITAGNASGINDGAAMLMLTSLEQSKLKDLKPLARIVAWSQTGCEPMLMGVAPIQAIQKVLDKSNWSIDDVDLYEINEAFASQSIAILRELNLDQNKVNVNGGSIAIGHPIGASGARILVTLIHSMIRLNKKRGLASLCIGGGMSIAMTIELI